MTTESSASDSACSNVDACGYTRGSSSLASRLKLKKLTTVKTQQTVKLPVHASAPSDYFASNLHSDGGNRGRRAAKNVSNTSNTQRSDGHRNDGPPVVACAKRTRRRRNKRQSAEAAQGTAKRKARKKRVESEVRLTTEIDTSSSDHLQPSCAAVPNYKETIAIEAPEASNDDNISSSSSDVEWEDVEGRNFC